MIGKTNKLSYYLLFFIWPFAALLPAIKRFKEPIGRSLFILVISFLGYTTTSEGDLQRYEMMFYLNQDNTILDLFRSYINLQQSDIYADMLSILLGKIFNTHHIFFAILYAVFAYFYSGILRNFLFLSPSKLSRYTLIAFFGFALYYSIRSTISIRFYTGGLYFLFMITNYLISNKNKYLIYSLFSPFFHFGLTLLIVTVPAFLMLRKRLGIAFIIMISSFFIGQTTILSGLESIVINAEDTFFESRYNSYAADEGRERMEELYEERRKSVNWKVKTLDTLGKIIFYTCITLTFLLFFIKKKFLSYPKLKYIFLLLMLLVTNANLMLNISNGDRYMHIYIFAFLGFTFVLVAQKIYKKLVQALLYAANILGLSFGIASLYAANPLFTIEFFLFNYPLIFFISQ